MSDNEETQGSSSVLDADQSDNDESTNLDNTPMKVVEEAATQVEEPEEAPAPPKAAAAGKRGTPAAASDSGKKGGKKEETPAKAAAAAPVDSKGKKAGTIQAAMKKGEQKEAEKKEADKKAETTKDAAKDKAAKEKEAKEKAATAAKEKAAKDKAAAKEKEEKAAKEKEAKEAKATKEKEEKAAKEKEAKEKAAAAKDKDAKEKEAKDKAVKAAAAAKEAEAKKKAAAAPAAAKETSGGIKRKKPTDDEEEQKHIAAPEKPTPKEKETAIPVAAAPATPAPAKKAKTATTAAPVSAAAPHKATADKDGDVSMATGAAPPSHSGEFKEATSEANIHINAKPAIFAGGKRLRPDELNLTSDASSSAAKKHHQRSFPASWMPSDDMVYATANADFFDKKIKPLVADLFNVLQAANQDVAAFFVAEVRTGVQLRDDARPVPGTKKYSDYLVAAQYFTGTYRKAGHDAPQPSLTMMRAMQLANRAMAPDLASLADEEKSLAKLVLDDLLDPASQATILATTFPPVEMSVRTEAAKKVVYDITPHGYRQTVNQLLKQLIKLAQQPNEDLSFVFAIEDSTHAIHSLHWSVPIVLDSQAVNMLLSQVLMQATNHRKAIDEDFLYSLLTVSHSSSIFARDPVIRSKLSEAIEASKARRIKA